MTKTAKSPARPCLALALCLGCGATPSTTPAPVNMPTPPEIAGRASVRFEIAGASGYVVTRGRSCRTFEVERESDGGFQPVPLDLGYTCVCDCAGPGGPAVIQLSLLSAAGPYAMTWDGRQMVSARRTVDCATRAPGASGAAVETVGALQPLPAGRYRASFAVLPAAPPQCVPLMEGLYCAPDDSHAVPPSGAYPLCPGPRVTVTFDLPESGAITVPVPTGR